MPSLLSFAFFPFAVGYIRHDFHTLFDFFVFFIFPFFIVILHLLMIEFFLLLDETLLKPILESPLTLLILMFFLKSFVLLLPKFFLSLKGFSHQFSLFPFIHALSSVLIFLV